jgi:hypothetical protein
VTRGGTVSLLNNLSEDVAIETVKRLTPWHERPDVKWEGIMGFQYSDSDLVRIEAFGPEGKKLDVWRTNGPTHA